MITLGDCAVTDVRGRRPVARGTLTEVLRETSSATPATTKTTWLDVERRTSTFFQNPPDPKLMPEEQPSSRSVTHAGTGGPHDEVQRGPCTLNGQGRCRCRGAKLVARFLLGKFDLDAINRKTLAATPYSVYPSYIQVLRAGMAAAGAGGVGNAGFGSVMVAVLEEGVTEPAVVEVAQVVVLARVVVDRSTAAGTATTTTTTAARSSTDLASIPTSGLICPTTARARITSGGEVAATAAMVVVDGTLAIGRVEIINDTSSGFSGCHHRGHYIKRRYLRMCRTSR